MSASTSGAGRPARGRSSRTFVRPFEQQTLGIIGESGSGKTVLSRLAIGAVSPPLQVVKGSVLYRGRNILGMDRKELQRLRVSEFGYIGSNLGSVLDPTIAVGEQIVEKIRAFDPTISRKEAADQDDCADGAARLPAPAKRFHEFPFQYSGGMMQRALIVDALVTNPAFLVADNVTQPLDVTVAAQILRLMRSFSEDFRTAIIFSVEFAGRGAEVAGDLIVSQ